MPSSPTTDTGPGPVLEDPLPVRLLLVDAGRREGPWTAALEAAGVDARTRTVADEGEVPAALREPLDLILAWGDPGGRRAPEVLATVRREGLEVPVVVVAGSESAGEAAASAAALLPADRPSWLPGVLDRVLRRVRIETRLALTGRIAHDLNNLLAPIPLAVQLLRRHDDGPVDPGQVEAVNAASRGSMAAVRDLSELLVAREDAPLQVRAKHLLAITARHWRHALEGGAGAPAAVLVDYPPDLASVRVDVVRLLQVLSCLVRRALDGAPGGELFLRGRNVGPGSSGGWASSWMGGMDAPAVELRVACAGSGVEARVDEALPSVAGGPGEDGEDGDLGVLREVVEAHGGRLGVLGGDPPRWGFALLLPATAGGPFHSGTSAGRRAGRPGPPAGRPAPEARRARPTAETWPPPVRPPDGTPDEASARTVLLVDGDTECRRMAQETLEGFGYRVLTAADGTEGVAVFAARAGGVAAVVVDYSMPHMDGPATLKALHRIDPTVPTVLTTGAEWEARRIEHDGPDAVLRKPYDSDDLREALQRVLGRPPGGTTG